MRTVDCMIIGSGAAGVATAVELQRQGLDVTLIDRSAFQQWRVGETLPPEIKAPLRQLDLWEAFCQAGFLPSHGIWSSWGGPMIRETSFFYSPYGNAWHVERRKLDAMLASEAAKKGCELLLETRFLSAVYRNELWEVNIVHQNQLLPVRAKVLVDASGRTAAVARMMRRKKIPLDKLISISCLCKPAGSGSPGYDSLLLEAAEMGWWYAAPLPDERFLITYLTDADLWNFPQKRRMKEWSELLNKTNHIRRWAEGLETCSSLTTWPAESACLDTAAGTAWLAVGDASCTFDPLAGKGVFKALSSGITAAAAIRNFLSGEKNALVSYAEQEGKIFNDYQARRNEYYELEERWGCSPFWQRRRCSVE